MLLSMWEGEKVEVSKKVRCGACRGCSLAADCGTCSHCMDKPKFGGNGEMPSS